MTTPEIYTPDSSDEITPVSSPSRYRYKHSKSQLYKDCAWIYNSKTPFYAPKNEVDIQLYNELINKILSVKNKHISLDEKIYRAPYTIIEIYDIGDIHFFLFPGNDKKIRVPCSSCNLNIPIDMEYYCDSDNKTNVCKVCYKENGDTSFVKKY